VSPRVGLDDVEKIKFLTLPGLELRPLCRPARSQSLYRLWYLGFSAVVLYLLLLYFNSVGITSRIWAGQPKNRGSIRGTGKRFSLSVASRPALWLNHPSTDGVLRAVSPGVKGFGHESNHSPQFPAKFKNSGVILPLRHIFSWRGIYMIKHTLNIFYFYDNIHIEFLLLQYCEYLIASAEMTVACVSFSDCIRHQINPAHIP
jgi:hypothetical protein